MFKPWINLMMLAAESQQVIGLRVMQAALGGPKAKAEKTLMVTEKVAAAKGNQCAVAWRIQGRRPCCV